MDAARREAHYKIYQALSVKVAGELIHEVTVLKIQGQPLPQRVFVRLAVPTIRYANPKLRALALDGGLMASIALRLESVSNSDVILSREPVDAIIDLPALDRVPVIRLAPNSCDIVNPHVLSGAVCLVDAWSPVLSVGADLLPALMNLLTLQPATYSLDPSTHLNTAAGRWLIEQAPSSGIPIPLRPAISGLAVAHELRHRWSDLLRRLDAGASAS